MTTIDDVEFWTGSHGVPGYAARRATALESEGWSGMGIVDSQCLSGDPYVAAALAGAATSQLRLATGVTNTVTRHPAVTAAAAASVQAETGGRFVLGLGRGDSALAHIGLAPAPLPQFERHLERLQVYLRREEVPFDLETDAVNGLRSVDALEMDSAPSTSQLHWLSDASTKVPVDVAASGPKVIEIAARHADAVTFALGVDTSRLGVGDRSRPAGASSRRAGSRLVAAGVVHSAVRARGPRHSQGVAARRCRFVRPVLGDARHGRWAGGGVAT